MLNKSILHEERFFFVSNKLHIEAIANLRLFVDANIFHDVSNLLRALQRDWQAPVHLGVVPVHLGQSENLVTEALQGRVLLVDRDLERARNVLAWIGLVKVDRAAGIKDALRLRDGEQGPSLWWVLPVAEQPDVCVGDGDKVLRTDALLLQRAQKASSLPIAKMTRFVDHDPRRHVLQGAVVFVQRVAEELVSLIFAEEGVTVPFVDRNRAKP